MPAAQRCLLLASPASLPSRDDHARTVHELTPPERFDRSIAHRLADDPTLARLLARLGARLGFEDGGEHEGEGHHAPLAIIERPMRLHVRLEPTGAPGYLQAVRFSLAVPEGVARPPGWLPVLDVSSERLNTWTASRPFGAWGRGQGRLLGYQGWWQHSPGIGNADVSTRILAHARHERGRLLWIGSRTNLETPGDLHKHVIAVIVDDDR